MRKFIAVLTLVLAFAISATAQTKKLSSDAAGAADTAKLSEFVQLTAEQEIIFNNLFAIKHRNLNNAEMPLSRKEELVSTIGDKIKGSLTEEQIKKLNSNPALLRTLTGADVITTADKKKE